MTPIQIRNRIDASAAMDASARKDYSTILSNADFFYALFCRAISSTVPENWEFYVYRKENVLTICGSAHQIEYVQKSIEHIRVLLEKGYKEQRAVAVLAIQSPIPWESKLYIREESDTTIDLSSAGDDVTIYEFQRFIVPAMQKFSKILGATCVQSRTAQVINRMRRPESPMCPKFLINWEPMPPKKVTLNRIFYDLQAAGKLCDCTLISNDGTAIHAHSLVLHSSRKSKFQNVGPNTRVHFEQFSSSKLLKAVKKVYLGKESIGPLSKLFSGYRNPGDTRVFIIDISATSALLAAKNYRSIIFNPDHFLATFLINIGNMPPKPREECFQVRRLNNFSLTIWGESHTILGVQKCVESMRQLFEKSINKKRDVTIACTKAKNSFSMFMREFSAEPIDLTGWKPTPVEFSRHIFADYISPCLQTVMSSLGAECSKIKKSYEDMIRNFNKMKTDSQQTQCFTINWDKDTHFADETYEMYKKKEGCNFSLIAADGTEFRIHDLILYTNGGEAFQMALSASMQESKTKSFHFPTATAAALEQFVDFLYLGPEALLPERFIDREFDISLLEIANQWKTPGLFDACTNLMRVACVPEDMSAIAVEYTDAIVEAAERYEDPQLNSLAAQLATTSLVTGSMKDTLISIAAQNIPQLAIRSQLLEYMTKIWLRTKLDPGTLIELVKDIREVRLPTSADLVNAIVDTIVNQDKDVSLLGRLIGQDREQAISRLKDLPKAHETCIRYLRQLIYQDSNAFNSHKSLNDALKLLTELLIFGGSLTPSERDEFSMTFVETLSKRRPSMWLVGDTAFTLDREFKEICGKLFPLLGLEFGGLTFALDGG